MAKRCLEEFNPWPPFVDIFASVILVMLLFMLILLVDLSYYAQFSFKETVAEETIADEQAAGRPETPIVIQKEVVEEQEEKDPRMISMFEGTKSLEEGNAIARDKERDKSYSTQQVIESKGEFVVKYQDKEMFAKKSITSQLNNFISRELARGGIKKVEITVSDATHVVSKTVSKQISIGRVLDIKNRINRSGVEKSNISINLQKREEITHPFGFVKVRIYK